jgi:hypothetical protein
MLVTEQFEILERGGLFLEHDEWRRGRKARSLSATPKSFQQEKDNFG